MLNQSFVSMIKSGDFSWYAFHFLVNDTNFWNFKKKVSCGEKVITFFPQNQFSWTFNMIFWIKFAFSDTKEAFFAINYSLTLIQGFFYCTKLNFPKN